MSVSIKIQAQLTWAVKRLEASWIGVCDSIGITLEADNESELRSMIEETQHTLFLDLFEDGELDAFLRDRGWAALSPIPRHMPEGGVRFDVPFDMVPAPPHGHSRTAHQ